MSMPRRSPLACAFFTLIYLRGLLVLAQNATEHLTPGTIIVASEKLNDGPKLGEDGTRPDDSHSP
jgi:hypothetical protein